MTKQPPIDIKNDFAMRFRAAMDAAGMDGSIRQKADRFGISKSYMADLLNSISLPSRENSIKFAAMLGVRESWLMEGSGPMRQELTPLVVAHWSAEDKAMILALYKSINEKYQR